MWAFNWALVDKTNFDYLFQKVFDSFSVDTFRITCRYLQHRVACISFLISDCRYIKPVESV